MIEQSEGPSLDWAALRNRYEQTQETVTQIAVSAGFTRQAFSRKAKALGWLMRKKSNTAKTETTRQTLRRLKDILQKRITQLEGEIGAIGEELNALTNEREIRSANTLVRTLEKVLELEQKDRKQRAKRRGDAVHLDDTQRNELAGRIDGLRQGGAGESGEPQAEPGRSDSPVVGLAAVGEVRSTAT